MLHLQAEMHWSSYQFCIVTFAEHAVQWSCTCSHSIISFLSRAKHGFRCLAQLGSSGSMLVTWWWSYAWQFDMLHILLNCSQYVLWYGTVLNTYQESYKYRQQQIAAEKGTTLVSYTPLPPFRRLARGNYECHHNTNGPQYKCTGTRPVYMELVSCEDRQMAHTSNGI